MKKISIELFHVIVHSAAHTDGEGIEVPIIDLEVDDLQEEVEVLPVFVSWEDAKDSHLMAEMATNLPEDREPGTYSMPPWQLKGYLQDNPIIGAVLLVYPGKEFLLRREDFFGFLEHVEPGPAIEDVLGLSA